MKSVHKKGNDMKPSEILRIAAKSVESGEQRWGCGAIAAALGRYDDWDLHRWPIPRPFFRHFVLMCDRPDQRHHSGYFGFEDDDHRIVAMCLAAAIAESEGQ